MPTFRSPFVVLVPMLALSFASSPVTSSIAHAAPSGGADVVVLRAARVFDAQRGVMIADGAVLVEDGRVHAVGAKLAAPKGAREIAFGDATILPGLIDAHVHLDGERDPDYYKGALDDLRRSDAERAARATEYARRTLHAGFTTVRDLGSSGDAVLGVRNAIADGLVVGPRILVSRKSLGARGGHCDPSGGFPPDTFTSRGLDDGLASGPDGFRDLVRHNVKHGADVIKVCATGGVLSLGDSVDAPQLTDAELVAIVDEAHRLGKKVAAHAHGDAGAKSAVNAGVDSIEHGTFLTQDTLALMKKKGTVLVPTMCAFSAIRPDENDFPPEVERKARAAIAKRAQSLALAKKIGVRIAAGTDAGVSRHGTNGDELVFLVEGGLTPTQALLAATLESAKLLGVDDEAGSLETGKLADVVVVAGDPAKDIKAVRSVVFVMKGGRVVRDERAAPAGKR